MEDINQIFVGSELGKFLRSCGGNGYISGGGIQMINLMTSSDKDSKSSEPEHKKQKSNCSQQKEDEKESMSSYVPTAIAQAIAIKTTTLPDLNIPDERRTSSDEEDMAVEPPLSDSELPERFRNPKKKNKKNNKDTKKIE